MKCHNCSQRQFKTVIVVDVGTLILWFICTVRRWVYLEFEECLRPVARASRICHLYLCKGLRPPPQQVSCTWRYTASDGVDPVLELWKMWSTPSLALLSRPLWPGVVVQVGVQSMGQIELFNHLLYLKPFNSMQTNKWCWIELLLLDSNTWNHLGGVLVV